MNTVIILIIGLNIYLSYKGFSNRAFFNKYKFSPHEIKRGEKIGYRNAFEAPCDMRVAVIPVGYADGLNRKLGDGKGKVLVDNKECPILGHVSMDSFVADISNTSAIEGDIVTIFSADFSIQKIANDLNTIPYEILATINRRIKRVYDFPIS